MVVGGCSWFLGGFRSFHVLVLTVNCVVSELFPLRGEKHIKLCP